MSAPCSSIPGRRAFPRNTVVLSKYLSISDDFYSDICLTAYFLCLIFTNVVQRQAHAYDTYIFATMVVFGSCPGP